MFLLLYTTAFTEERSVMWDFGVIINNSVQPIQHNVKIQSPPKQLIQEHSQDKALIADPFIPPTLTSLTKTASDLPFFSEPFDGISLNNIYQVKLLAGRLTMQYDYQTIIDMIYHTQLIMLI